ncbi:MAG: hypothetical protein ACRYGR_01940 [Janthinobacterium lividum]
MPDMPNTTEHNKWSDSEKKARPSSIIAAMARMMQFVERIESHVSMLDDMPIANDTKWETIAAIIKREVPSVKKDVSADMSEFMTALMHNPDA